MKAIQLETGRIPAAAVFMGTALRLKSVMKFLTLCGDKSTTI